MREQLIAVSIREGSISSGIRDQLKLLAKGSANITVTGLAESITEQIQKGISAAQPSIRSASTKTAGGGSSGSSTPLNVPELKEFNNAVAHATKELDKFAAALTNAVTKLNSIKATASEEGSPSGGGGGTSGSGSKRKSKRVDSSDYSQATHDEIRAIAEEKVLAEKRAATAAELNAIVKRNHAETDKSVRERDRRDRARAKPVRVVAASSSSSRVNPNDYSDETHRQFRLAAKYKFEQDNIARDQQAKRKQAAATNAETAVERATTRARRSRLASNKVSVAEDNVQGSDKLIQYIKANQSFERRQRVKEDKISGIAEKFGDSLSGGEFFQRLIGNSAGASKIRQGRIASLAADHPELQGLAGRLEATKELPLLSGKNFKDPAVLAQVAFGGVFGGAGGLATAALGAATPLGAGGALLAGAAQQAISSLIIDPFVDLLRSNEAKFREAGEAYAQSILAITSVLQSSSRVVGANGQPVGIGAQLNFQEKRATQIQQAARQLLLPQGIGGATEGTFVSGVVSSLNQRGFANSDPQSIAKISQILAGIIRAQRPQLLENPALLNRDLQDVLSGQPQANRTVLGSLLRGALPGIGKAQSGEEVLKALQPYQAFSQTVSESQNIKAVQGRLEGTRELNATLGGEAFLDALKPAIQSLTETLKDPEVQEANKNFGEALGRLAKISINFEASMAKLGAQTINLLSPFQGLIDIAPKLVIAFVTAAASLNAGGVARSLGLNVGKGVGSAVGLLGVGAAAVEAATAITEQETEKKERLDDRQRERVEAIQAARAIGDPQKQAEISLQNAGLFAGIQASGVEQSQSPSNQLESLRKVLNPAFEGSGAVPFSDNVGAFNALGDAQLKSLNKNFGGGTSDLFKAQQTSAFLRSDERNKYRFGLANAADETLSKALSGIASADEQKESANKDIAKFTKLLSDDKSEGEKISKRYAFGAIRAGVPGSEEYKKYNIGPGETLPPIAEFQAALNQTKSEHAAGLKDANERLAVAQANSSRTGVTDINNWVDAQKQVLDEAEKQVQAQKSSTQAANEMAANFRGVNQFSDRALKSSADTIGALNDQGRAYDKAIQDAELRQKDVSGSPALAASLGSHITELKAERSDVTDRISVQRQQYFAQDLSNRQRPLEENLKDIGLSEALRQSSQLIDEETSKRRSLNASLESSQEALSSFDLKVKSQTIGSENSLASLGEKIKAEGGSIPLSTDFSPERIKEAETASDVAKFNEQAAQLGIAGTASGGRALGISSPFSPLGKAQDEERAKLGDSIRQTANEIDGLNDSFEKLRTQIQITVNSLTKPGETPKSVEDTAKDAPINNPNLDANRKLAYEISTGKSLGSGQPGFENPLAEPKEPVGSENSLAAFVAAEARDGTVKRIENGLDATMKQLSDPSNFSTKSDVSGLRSGGIQPESSFVGLETAAPFIGTKLEKAQSGGLFGLQGSNGVGFNANNSNGQALSDVDAYIQQNMPAALEAARKGADVDLPSTPHQGTSTEATKAIAREKAKRNSGADQSSVTTSGGNKVSVVKLDEGTIASLGTAITDGMTQGLAGGAV